MIDESKYISRPNSRIIVRYMNENGLDKKEVADRLGVTVKDLRYKLLQNSFTLHDFVKCAGLEEFSRFYEEASYERSMRKKNERRMKR